MSYHLALNESDWHKSSSAASAAFKPETLLRCASHRRSCKCVVIAETLTGYCQRLQFAKAGVRRNSDMNAWQLATHRSQSVWLLLQIEIAESNVRSKGIVESTKTQFAWSHYSV